MRKVMLIVAVAVLCVGSFLLLRHRAPASYRTLTVCQPRILDMAPLYVGMEKHCFEEEGLRIRLIDVGSPLEGLDQVAAGKANVAFAGDTGVAVRIAQGAPLTILCSTDGSSHTVGILMKKMGDLQNTLPGKRIGVRLWTSPHYFLDTYLLYNLIPHNRIKLIDMKEDCLEQALLSGDVDAVAGFQADLSRITQRHPELHVIYPEEIYRAFWIVVANDRFVATEPENVVRFLRGLDRAASFMLRHEPETVAIVSRYTGVTDSKIREHFPLHHFEVSLDNSLLVLLEQEGTWAAKHGAAHSSLPDYRKKFDAKAMKKVRPEGITLID